MNNITLDDKIENYDQLFIKSLSHEEKQLFENFMETIKLDEKESVVALIRFAKYPDTYKRFSVEFNIDITMLIDKCIDFLIDNELDKKFEIKRVTAEDLGRTFDMSADIRLGEIWLE